MVYGNGNALQTISQEGKVPETRMVNARACQDFALRLVDNDTRRDFKRSRVNGLVDGNPPYRASKLREAGRAEAANFNSGTARSFLETAAGAFYDLFSEAPDFITFRTGHGNNDQKETWSDVASAAANEIIRRDKTWDYQMQISQWDMVLHACGPFFYEDVYSLLPRATLCRDLRVPEFTKSDTNYWEACTLEVVYFPPELYKFIMDDQAAASIGWNVEYTKKVIANAMDIQQQPGVRYDWTFYQQQLKNNSIQYYDDTKVCIVEHCFWKEFDGRITHAIVEKSTTVGADIGKKVNSDNSDIQYLFISVGRFANWQEVVHPMYYDHGNGGYHHSVTGLGVKMYSLMEYQNRLVCNLSDKAFAPKILFKPTTTTAQQKFSLMHLGDYAVLPPNFEVQQSAIQGVMQDGLTMLEELGDIMNSNLSNYKQGVTTQKSGNPVTKFEKQMEAAMQSALSMPQYNRYYKQLDYLYSEFWRRLTNPNTTDERAQKFQSKMKHLGVPQTALMTVEYIGATRVVGQGSAFMRKQAIDSLMEVAGTLPEDGRNNLVSDKIAAEAGQAAVARYNPRRQKNQMATDQQADAMIWVGQMKLGISPVITSTQNPVTYAATFLNAAVQSVNSLQKGGDPHQVLAFLNICGPAIAAYLRRFGQDATRKTVHQQMMSQWKQLSQLTDQLTQQMVQQAKAQKQQNTKTQSAMSDAQIAQAKAKNDISIKQAKTRAQLQQSAEKHRLQMAQKVQDLQIRDSTAAADIHLSRMRAFQE